METNMTKITVKTQPDTTTIPATDLKMGQCGIYIDASSCHNGSIVQMTVFGLIIVRPALHNAYQGDGWSMEALRCSNEHRVRPISEMDVEIRCK